MTKIPVDHVRTSSPMDKDMKILWLSHLVPYPPKGGVLQRSYHLLKELSKYHQVDLLAFNQKRLMEPLVPSLEEGLTEAKSHLSGFCRKVEFFDIPSERTSWTRKWLALKSLFTSYPYTLNWLLSDEFYDRLKELVAHEDYDYVHFDTISLAPYLSACGNLKASLDHHNIESHMLLRRSKKESNILKKVYFQQEGRRLEKYEKYFCPRFAFNYTCSDLDGERLNRISKNSIVYTVPNGVDINFFKPLGKKKRERSMAFIGGLGWYPNTQAVKFLLEKIWPKVYSKYPDSTLDIVGSKPPDSIKRLAKKYNGVTVHGFVDDIMPIFDSAMCYVCPIKDGGGTKLKILDALAMGKAIVADPISCEGIDVEDGVNVLFAETPDEYVKAISRVFDDAGVRDVLEKKSRALAVEKYSYENIGKKLVDLYRL